MPKVIPLEAAQIDVVCLGSVTSQELLNTSGISDFRGLVSQVQVSVVQVAPGAVTLVDDFGLCRVRVIALLVGFDFGLTGIRQDEKLRDAKDDKSMRQALNELEQNIREMRLWLEYPLWIPKPAMKP
jgi:hypothetical protein